MKIIKPQTMTGPAEWFKGEVHPTSIITSESPSRVNVAMVHFAPGSRSAWHSHPVGQYLHIVEGTALMQERGEKLMKLRPGETVYTPPNIEHWHGASPDSFMVHLAIWESPNHNGPAVKWGEHVTDEEYQQHKDKD